MQDDMKQRISQLIDADLNNQDALNLLKAIRQDETLRSKMIRYQAINHSIKTGKFEPVRADFAQSITDQILQEPAYLLPPKKQSSSAKLKIYATAASVLAVAILAGQGIRLNHPANDSNAITLADNSSQLKSPPAVKSARNVKGKPLSAEFNAYLQAHNGNFYNNGEANYQSNAKVASFGR